jgi:glycerol uptake facilitator-like aquaporin
VVAVVTYQFTVPPLLIAIAHIIILSFFIISTAKSSGGHLNPMLSFATMIAGFTTPSRAIMYIFAQTIGSILGAGLLLGILDATPAALGGCTLGSISQGRALLCEVVGSCIILFIAFGTALDVGQREVFGPVLGPFFVSFTLAIVIFLGGGIAPGYSVSINFMI